jgi:hypothetical protein
MKNGIFLTLAICLASFMFPVHAQETGHAKEAVTGTWSWTTRQSNGELYSSVMDIELNDAGNLAGALRHASGDRIAFESVYWSDSTIKILLSYEVLGHPFQAEYEGRLTKDALEGTVRIKFVERTIERSWKAVRVQDYPLDGEWDWKLQTPDGNELKAVLRIHHTKDGVGGRLVSDQFDSELNNARFSQGVLQFTTTSQDGNTTYASKGKWHGNRLVGEVGSPSFGDDLKLTWEAVKR